MQSSFRYGIIENLMVQVVDQLQEAGYTDKAKAMLALTHIVGSRIEPIDTSHGRGIEYELDCLTYQRDLLLYLTGPDQPLLATN
jgi:hypothetical protein